jgi:tryptophan-rich sensory protein
VKQKRHLAWTAAALTGTALAGAAGTDVRSNWYRSLAKPRWQPPGWVFGPAWTTLYALIAVASARTLDRLDDPAERTRYRLALAANLVLNIGWSWIFFRAHRPRLALAEMLALEVSTVDLILRSVRHDQAAAGMLTPYAGWIAFATALTTAIAQKNPPGGSTGS